MAEQTAVNRQVVGSSPAWGACVDAYESSYFRGSIPLFPPHGELPVGGFHLIQIFLDTGVLTAMRS